MLSVHLVSYHSQDSLKFVLDCLFFMFCCFVSVCCNQDQLCEVWGSIVLCKTCNVLLCVFEQSRVDNSTVVPFQRGAQLPLLLLFFFYQNRIQQLSS